MLRHGRNVLLSLPLLIGALWFVPVDNGLWEGDSPRADYSALAAPRLAISFHQRVLQLEGHTASRHQESALRESADRLFVDARTSASFKPFGTVPDYWTPASIALLEAVSTTLSSNAMLGEGKVSIRGVSTASWETSALRLRNKLPATLELDIDMIIAVDVIDKGDLCARAFSRYRTGAIRFEESGTVLRGSAESALDRAISLANACRESIVTVTGHTDSSGMPEANRALSLARANTIAGRLENGGIARERLRTIGAGSSEPLASNSSRYGRSLNRRIEIEFRQVP